MFRLAAIRHVRFADNTEWRVPDGVADVFFERCAPYGTHVDRDRPLPGNHNSFSQMSARLLADLDDAGGVDLVVLAHAVPDCDPSRSVAGYLAERLPGEPMIYALSEQGRATSFAALRVARAMAVQDSYRRTAVVLLDQGTLTYDDPGLADLDIGTDHAVGLLFTADGSVRPGAVRQIADVTPDRVDEVLARELADLAPAGEVTVVAWPTARLDVHRYRAVPAPAGQLCTAVWSALAEELARPAPAPRTIVLAEYERALGYLCLAVFDAPARPGDSRDPTRSPATSVVQR